MLGGLLAFSAALTFALSNALFRRGALVGTAAQGLTISLGLGVVLFAAAAAVAGAWSEMPTPSETSFWLLCLAGVVHFAWARYCNFRATKAMGANLVGPPQQLSLLIALFLAVVLLGEALTVLRVCGILLIVLGSLISSRPRAGRLPSTAIEGKKGPVPPFQPNYVEGYTFALLSALGYGGSPIMVSAALEGASLPQSVAGGLVAYVAAAAVLLPGLLSASLRRHILSVAPVALRWFSASSILVGLSQMAGYIALSVAPVSVVTPIQRLSLVFRVLANSAFNREHEVLDGRVWLATVVSLAGALALSLSVADLAALLSGWGRPPG